MEIRQSVKENARYKARKYVALKPCEVCQTTQHVHRHHDDYSKPLDVRFLCQVHHMQQHNPVRKKYDTTAITPHDYAPSVKEPIRKWVKVPKQFTPRMMQELLNV